MSRRTIATVILLATLSVVGVVLTQVLWLDRAFNVQKQEAELHLRQQQQLDKQFNDRVTIALTAVAEKILSINKDPSDLYDAVKQARPNYFAVAINDTVHPYLLEALLRKEFMRRNIVDDFEYGIYDCFTDSVVYGNYVSLLDSTVADTARHSQLLKLDKDGHYFGVYFPRRNSSLWEPKPRSRATWIYPAIVTLIVFGFFAYSLLVILRQKRLSEIKNDFIGNMTHELKTPISTIALSSEVLCEPGIEREPERLRMYAGIIRSENERLRTQVERVLQLATLDRENLALKRERVDLHAIIGEVCASFAVQVKERSGTLGTDLQAQRHTVTGDTVHLTNMLFNLVDNAVKYSPGLVEVTIATRNEGGQLCISVRDRGLGIRREDQRHVFERFYRVPTGNVHNVKGFGLGLHYVQQIVHAHGGTIGLASEPGAGSTFTIRLPINHDAA
ncbi:MAG: HAMP domain-containing histidine kinase [Flavobacteriales bacterium]|nr:HAMP domain-containing histidine kinase [Flavobacteriales bacterium]